MRRYVCVTVVDEQRSRYGKIKYIRIKNVKFSEEIVALD